MTWPLHPDQLGPDHRVGPWRIVSSLGAGGFGRVFKVERGGRFFALKMALRPAGSHASEEEDVNGRLAHEVAALLACTPHPHLPRVHAVDRWPEPPDGYFYFVTDFVDGETFHEWRWRVKPTAAHLLSVYTEVVRVVADLHRRGVHHRDLKSDNLLIRREDERPFVIDLGTVRMPGASTLTVGVAPASPHLLPPECVAFLREGTWQQGAHFDAGVPGDLYALGALLYEALTDGYAFDPKLPYDRLLPAIETVTPRAPHVVNPKAPQALGDIALRLLAKRPEDRYPSAEALLQALWEAAKEKRQSAWKVSLDVPGEDAAPVASITLLPREQVLTELARVPPSDAGGAEPPSEATAEVATVDTPRAPTVPGPAVEPVPAVSSPPVNPETPEPGRVGRHAAVRIGVGAVLLLGLVVLGLSRLAPSTGARTAPVSPEKGSVPVTHTPSPPDAAVLAAALPADAGVEQAPVPEVAREEAVARASEAPTPKKRKTDGGVLRKAAGAAVATCMGVGCAGAHANLPERPPKDACPDGAIEAMARLNLPLNEYIGSLMIRDEDFGLTKVREGNVLLVQGTPNDTGFPMDTRYQARVVFTRDRTHVYVTEARLPDGRRVPVCLEFYDQNSRLFGYPKKPGDGDVERIFPVDAFSIAVSRFGVNTTRPR